MNKSVNHSNFVGLGGLETCTILGTLMDELLAACPNFV